MDLDKINLLFLIIPAVVTLHIVISQLNKILVIFNTGQEILYYLFFLTNLFFVLIFSLYFYDEYNLSYFFYFFFLINLFYYSYFKFYNMSETARRIRILIMIKTNKFFSVRDFKKNYNSYTQIESRLSRLEKMHQLFNVNNFYFLKSNVIMHVAKLFVFVKSILLGKK